MQDSKKNDLTRLFHEARAGSHRALELLLRKLRPVVYRKATRYVDELHPGVGPSTLTQEVSHGLAKIITKVRGSGDGTLWALVNKLVKTKGVSAFRHAHSPKRNGGMPLPLEDVVSVVIVEDQALDEQIAQKQRAHRLLVEIARLPERQRIALEAALAGEAPSVMAVRLQCSEGAVANLLQRIKQKLQQTDETLSPEPLTKALVRYLWKTSAGDKVDPVLFALEQTEHQAELRDFLLWLYEVRRLWSGTTGP